MAAITFEASAAFLTRARAIIVAEQPNLAGQSNAVLNEAVRTRIRQMVRDWVRNAEQITAARTAQNNVAAPNDADIL